MKVIVSINNYVHEGYKCVSSLKNLDWSAVECLIFNSSRDGEVDTILELSKAGEFVKKVIYINQTIHSLYYGLFAGMEADIYDDATMLQDKDTLDFLIEKYKETGMTIKSPNVDVDTISKFVATISKENADTLEKLIANGFWLKTLETSMSNVENALVRTSEANTNMVEMFNKTAEIISTLEEGHAKTSEEIEKLRQYVVEAESKTSNRQNTTFFFSTYTVPNTVSKVLYIRVYSPCKYLLSFISTYQHYLKMTKRVDSKVLLAAPKLKQFMKKYESFPRLAPETIGSMNLDSLGDFFVTYEPKSVVLNTFFNMKNPSNTTVHIVIDMMFGENLIAGAKVISLGAISGLSDIRKFDLAANKCIIGVAGLQSNIIIPYLKEYQKTNSESARRTYYFDSCKEGGKNGSYKRLDTLLFGE